MKIFSLRMKDRCLGEEGVYWLAVLCNKNSVVWLGGSSACLLRVICVGAVK